MVFSRYFSLFCLASMIGASGPWMGAAHARSRSSTKSNRAAPKSDNDKRRLSRHLFARAETAYGLGRFGQALKLYEKAFELLPLPGFLFNIGQCHRMLGHPERAVFFYRNFLGRSARVPMKTRLMVEGIISKLRAAIDTRQAQKGRRSRPRPRRVSPKDPAGKARRPSPRRSPQQAQRRRAILRPRVTLARPNRPSALTAAVRRPLHKRWWFWTAIAGGAALVVAAALGATLGRRDDGRLPAGTLGTIDVR